MLLEKTINPWAYKPWWCQPWSILLTGNALIAGSWWIVHQLWLTVLIAVPVTAWMGFFVLIWPRLMARMMAEEMVAEPAIPDQSFADSVMANESVSVHSSPPVEAELLTGHSKPETSNENNEGNA